MIDKKSDKCSNFNVSGTIFLDRSLQLLIRANILSIIGQHPLCCSTKTKNNCLCPFVYFIAFLYVCTDPSQPRQRACTFTELVQKQTTYCLQGWDIQEGRSETRSTHTTLPNPQEPGSHYSDCRGNDTLLSKPIIPHGKWYSSREPLWLILLGNHFW